MAGLSKNTKVGEIFIIQIQLMIHRRIHKSKFVFLVETLINFIKPIFFIIL